MAEIGKDIDRAISVLKEDGLVGIPTETVYGLAANALSTTGISKIFSAKNRPSFDPLISHVATIDQVKELVVDIPDKAHELADAFWPGPLTMILEKKKHIPDLLTSGLPRMAVRIPLHSMTRELLGQIDFPLAAPSANPFGYVSPTTAAHVNNQLGDKVDYILNGGKTQVGLESTIVSFENDEILVHRLGGITLEQLSRFGTAKLDLNRSSNPVAPGQLKSHYSPGKKLLMGDVDFLLKQHPKLRAGVISFGKHYPEAHKTEALSQSGDMAEAASNLFAALRDMDQEDIDVVFAEIFPDEGLGRAINDRLRRAAAT